MKVYDRGYSTPRTVNFGNGGGLIDECEKRVEALRKYYQNKREGVCVS